MIEFDSKISNFNKKSFYIENYGCQMNTSDSEIITSILLNNGFFLSKNLYKSNIILFNSCSVRKKAELTLKKRLENLKFLKKKKVLFIIVGCFSKEFKESLIEKNMVDFFVNPDSYKEIPNIFFGTKKKFFRKRESYDDIPILKKIIDKKITSFLNITRGCNNMCTFCIVPFTRGREVSNNPTNIIEKCKILYERGYKEVTLLGQNVDSYKWVNKNYVLYFSDLLDIIAKELPFMRIRFTTSNPHDMSKNVLETIYKHKNICKHIHLPVQSGSNKILKLMNRKYSREDYILLIKKIKDIIPNCSISHDIMTGFCNEEEKDHLDTISLMNKIKYNYGYMFSYSPRPGTYAYKKLYNNVPEYIKKRRLKEIIKLQNSHSLLRMKEYIGKLQEVLIEGLSKKNNNFLYGRNTQNLVIVFPKKHFNIGDTVFVKVKKATSATLIGDII